MEAFTFFLFKFLRRKTKVLICLKMKKTKQGRKRVKNVYRVLLRKGKWNEKRNERRYKKNGDVGKTESFRKEF